MADKRHGAARSGQCGTHEIRHIIIYTSGCRLTATIYNIIQYVKHVSFVAVNEQTASLEKKKKYI